MPGVRIPGYKIEKRIAQGGMSSVFLATQVSLGRRVALKLLNKFDSPQHAQRFLNEARTVASLQHRNIITVHDVGVIGERHYIAMEYLEGGSLLDRIDHGMPPELALDLLESIAGCLDFVHRRGIVHRDVKPGNILFHADGTAKLTDFGIAKQLDGDQEITMDGSAFGSPYYLSPEQAEGQPLDGRCDIYALGIVFHQMLTGRRPYAEKSHIETIVAHLSHPIPLLPDALSGYQGLFECMIAKRPQDRIENAAALLERIRATRLAQTRQSAGTRSRPTRAGFATIGRIAARARAASTTRKASALGALTVLLGGALLLPGVPADDPDKTRAARAETGATSTAEQAPEQVARPGPDMLPEAAERPLQAARVEAAATDVERPPPARQPAPAPRPAMQAALGDASAANPAAKADSSPREPPNMMLETRLPDDAGRPLADSAVTADGTISTTLPAVEPATRIAQANAAPVADDPPDDERATIDTLMQAADRALRRLRLTTPVADSAYTHYVKVLELDPQHAGASAGIDRIADRYAALARDALQGNDHRLAGVYVQRGLQVRSDHVGLHNVQRDLRNAQQVQVAQQTRAAVQPSPPPERAEPAPARPTEGTGNIVRDLKSVWRSIFN